MMAAPRVEIDLDKIYHNALVLVERLALKGISVMGVTKATLGDSSIATALIRAGVQSFGDSRIENIEAMQQSGVQTPMSLIRSPMLSQVDRVVKHCTMSFNTELEVMRGLSLAAGNADCIHGVVLMVELGDLREGVMPCDVECMVQEILKLPHLKLLGIGANLACRYGVVPDATNMEELSALADAVAARFDLKLELVSGGNSANLNWALGSTDLGRINHLRLGESILLGREPLQRQPIEGLHLDAFKLVAEVIESKIKPSSPSGHLAQSAFGDNPPPNQYRKPIAQSLLAVGLQDIDPEGLTPPEGMEILGASSDHLIVSTPKQLSIGAEVRFDLNYSALVRAMTSPYVSRHMNNASSPVPA